MGNVLKSAEALDMLKIVMGTPDLVQIVCSLGTFDKMALEEFAIERTKDNANGFSFTCCARQQRIAVAKNIEFELTSKVKKKLMPQKAKELPAEKSKSLLKWMVN